LKGSAGALVAFAIILWFVGEKAFSLPAENGQSSETFTSAHASMGQAVRHFFGMRPAAIQPIAFPHRTHVEGAQFLCRDCHISVEQGPRAGIPDIRTCWGCHSDMPSNHSEIKKLRAYHDRGEDIPWQRVYGWNDEAHVRFNHSPHIRAAVECAACHGNVGGMGVAERVVDHTMGFCINCHKQRNVSNDCQTCHY